jgi:two-component system alkaline phosphatase synthesis response regulator PhoP
MKETIFFVEDDNSIHSLLKATLELNGYNAVGFVDPLDFLQAIKTQTPNLIVLDLMLPHMSGYDVIEQLNENPQFAKIPVIILSALSDEFDIVKGLDNGAVDYISKPFGVAEFIARIKSNLRKVGTETTRGVVSARNLVVDRDKHVCTLEGTPIVLTAKEFDLVSILVENSPNVVSRASLLKDIWGYDTSSIETRTLDMHVKTIREKFSAVTSEEYISTIRGVGFVVNGD